MYINNLYTYVYYKIIILLHIYIYIYIKNYTDFHNFLYNLNFFE